MNRTKNRYPIVGVPCDVTRNGLHAFHGVGEKYINAVTHGSEVCPLLIPAQGPGEDLNPVDSVQLNERLLENLDGLFLPGSPSNIEPKLYGNEQSLTPEAHDQQRDSLTIPLIRAAIERKIPIFAVCRGMQEVNVALGGTLHQRTYEIAGLNDHREDKSLNRQGQYSESHSVELMKDGYLESLAGSDSVMVNSLHGQGMNELAPGLIIEAKAADGLVEAFRLDSPAHYVVGVQWHPEWQFENNDFSVALFKSFGDAVRKYSLLRC